MKFFSEQTINELNEPIAKESVKVRKGTGDQELSYIASHHAIAEANRIFGFGMWETEIMHIQMVDKTQYQKPPYRQGDKPKDMVSISYTCHLKLIVKSEDGKATSHEDMGFGNGVAGDTAHGLGSCIELASKEAVTDALKRCLRYYGNQFGLSLYDKDSEALMTAHELQSTKPVTPEQLENLRSMYEPREIDDKWVIAAMAGEGLTISALTEMNQDWYHAASVMVYNYRLKEIQAKEYKQEVEKAIELMSQSVNYNMLKGLFSEAWQKASKFDDNELKLKAQNVYNEIKVKFEDAA